MPPEIDFVPDVQNDEGAPGAIDFQPDAAAALFGPSSLDLRPTFIPTLPPAETSPKLEAAKEMALALPQAFGIGLGAVEKGVGAAIGRIAGTGDTLEDVKRAIEEGEPLPVELAAAKARGIGGTLARVGLGLAETAPKIASLALFPGGILAQSIAAGGIFGLDAQGRFSPRAAAVGALLPGAGALAKGTIARGLAGAMERGTIGTMHPATQWITEEMGHQAALNAVMLTADSPELIELYHTDRDAFRRKIEDTIGMNLAFGLFGGIKRLRGAPTATQEYVRKNAEKFGKIADKMITQQIVGGAGQQAIEKAIAEAKARQKYAGFVKFPGDEDAAGSTWPVPPKGEEPPGFVPAAEPQLPPIEPKGPENAVQIGIPAPLPVEVPPQTGAQVVGQVREPESPAEARPPAEPAPPPVEPAKPVEPPKQPDVPQLSGLPEGIQQLFAGTPPPPKKKSIPIVIEIDGVQQPAYFEGYGTTATSLEPINPWISRLSDGGWTTGPIQPDAKIVWGKIPEAPKPAEEKPPEKAPEAEKPAAEPPAIDRSRTFTEQEAEDAGIASQLAREGWVFNLKDRKWRWMPTEGEPAAKAEEATLDAETRAALDKLDNQFIDELSKKYGIPVKPSVPAAEPYERLSVASDILERSADRSTDPSELGRILAAAGGIPNESRIAWAVANNPFASDATFAQAKANPALRAMATDDAIGSLGARRAELRKQRGISGAAAKPAAAPEPPTPPAEAAKPPASRGIANALRAEFEKYDSTGEYESIQDFVDAIDAFAAENPGAPVRLLEQAVARYRKYQEEDFREFGGRGDMDAAEEAFIRQIKQAIRAAERDAATEGAKVAKAPEAPTKPAMKYGVPAEQFDEMAKYNDAEQLARWGVTRAQLMERAALEDRAKAEAERGAGKEFPKLERIQPSKAGGMDAIRGINKRIKAWEEKVKQWLAGRPENKAIIWEETERKGLEGPVKGNVKALTRNIGDPKNPWRVTTFLERNGAYMPSGHRVYSTREAALSEEARDVLKLHDSMPGRVMDEQEVQGYRLTKDIPGQSKLVWYKFTGDPTSLRMKMVGTTLMQDYVRDSHTTDGRVAFTKPVTADLQDPAKIAERLKWLGLEEIPPERPAERDIKIVFDKDYSGPRYRYGMRNRPLQTGAQPKGWIVDSNRSHPDFKAFGTIDYPFPLTKEELYSYELVDLGEIKPTVPPAASETGTVPSGVPTPPTEGGKAPTGPAPSMTAEPGVSPGRSAASIRTDIRNAKAEIKRLTDIQKRLSKIGDKDAAAKRQRKIDQLKSKLSQYKGELSFKSVTRRKREPGTRPEGITTDDGMLYYIVGALGRVPIFMPDGIVMAQYKRLKSLSFRTPAQVEALNKILESFPADFEGNFGVDGSIARAAWDAAKRAGIENELFVPVKDGRRMMIDADFLEPLRQSKGVEFKTREFFEELTRLANARYERTKGRGSEAAEGAAAEKEVKQWESLKKDLAVPTKDTTVLLPEDVTKGTQFTLKGTKVKVIDLEYDEDGRLLWVMLDDGNKYGTQRIDLEDGRTELRMDVGSLKQPKGTESADEFLSPEEAEPTVEAPKPAAAKPSTEPKLSDRERQRLSDLQMKDRANRDAIGRGELGDPLTPEEQREYDDLTIKAGQRTLFDVEEVVAREERPALEGKLRNLEEKLAEMKRQQLLSLNNSQNRQMGGDKAKEFLNAAKTYEKRISETINEIADIKRKLRIGLTAEEEEKATPPEKPAEDDLFSQPAPKPKSAAPAKPSEGAMREEIADLERKLALLDAEWQDANAKNRKKKAREIGQQISDLGNRLNLLKSDLTEGQGEIVLRTPIAENPTTGEYESREYRLRQMTSQEFMDYFRDPMQRMRDFGTVYTPWRAEMRRVYYENGKEIRHDPWYIDAIEKTREEAIEKAASYSGRSAEGWRQIRDTLNKPKGPAIKLDEDAVHNWDADYIQRYWADRLTESQKADVQAAFTAHHSKGESAKDLARKLNEKWSQEISPEQPSAPISAGKEGASKGAGAAAKPISGLTAEESARLAELTAKVEANEPMTKAERDRFVELQRKAGGRGDEEPPEVKSGPDRPTLSLDELPANRDLVLREPKDPTLHRAVVEEARKRMAALFGKDILPEAFRQVEPDFSRVRDGNGQTLSEASRIALEQVLGQKIIFLDIEGSGISFHGAVFKEIPGFIFINARTPRPYLAIFGHEFAHSLRDQSPELYQELVLKLSSSLSRPGFMSFWSALRKTYASNRLRLPGADEATHELTANLVGDSFIDPKFWEVLAAKEPTLFAKLSSAAMQFIRDTWQKLKTFGAYQDFSDIRQAHEAIANTIARFAKDRAIKGASGEGISLSIDAAAEAGERPGGEKLGVTQVAGEKIGIERPMEFIAGIRQRVRTGYFDGSQPVETARTENAWEIAQRMINPETKGAFASELQRAGGGEMAPGLLRNELWDYAVRQAVRGDTSLMEFMVRRSQDFQTLAGEALANGDTALGRGLRAARDRAFGGLWSRLTAFRREQAAATGRRLQQGEAGLQQIIEAIDGLLANIGDIDAFERELRTPELQRVLDRTSETRQAADSIVSGSPFVPPERRSTILETVYQWMSREVDPQSDRTPFTDTLKAELERLRLTPEQAQTIADATWNRKLTVDGAIRRRLWDRELRRLDNLAEKTADAFILSVDKADWLKPESPNEVRDIIKAALKSESPLDSNNLLGFKRDLTQQLLTAGLSEQKARDLANAITKRRETDLLNAQLRIRDRAAESRSLTSLVESIKSSPYLAQQDPEWRFDTAVRWFESNGLSREQAQEAAKMFDAQFVSALTRAAEQAAKRLILKGDYGRNIPELVEAVRLGLTDPSKEWTEEIAKREGFRPLTPEAQQRLAALEEKYSNPNLSAHEQVAIVEQMMGIVRHAGDPKGRVMKIMGESFAASLLSGIRTMTLNWLQPWFTMVTTGAAHGVFEPRDFGTVVRSMWNASKNWWPEYKYAWSKDAYELSSEEQVFHSNALKTAFEDAQKNWAKGNYSKAVLEFAYGWQQYVIRGLQAADQAGMAVAREWKMALYGSIAMREAGLRTSQISELVDVAAGFKRAEYERALYDGKTHNEAQVIANEATIDAMTNFFENKLGSRRKAEAVEEAALYDAFNIVGRRAPGVDETAEGFLSRYSGLNRVMRFVSETRREGGGASILTIMAVGFMNVPMRTARFYAGFSPYGILRYGIDKYRTNRGQDPHWKQSFANEYQSKARLREALVGTSLMLAFLGWQHRHHTSDDDAEKKAFAMYVTGSGPSNKTMRDAWIKRGFEPYTLHIVANGAVRSKLPVNRVGQILAFPLGLAASLDDLAWRRKQEQAISPGKKEFAGREIVAAIGTYYNIVGAQGVLQAFSHLSQIGQGQSGTGRAVGVSLASTGSALAIPGKSLIQGVTDMMFGPVDRSSVEAAMMANVPVLNALWNGQAINRFGDQIGDRTWSARLSKLGVPILLRVSDTPENKELYQMLLDKGAAPPDLRRYIVEEKYGPLSQDEWQKFVKISGSKLKSDVLANLDSLNSTDPHGVKLFLNRAAQIANDQAAQSLHLMPKPTFSTATSAGGGAAVPTLPRGNVGLPTTPRISLPGGSLRGKSARLSSTGGYGSQMGSGTTGFRRARTGRLSLSGLTGGQQRFVRGRLRARSTRLSRFRRSPRISTRRRSFRRRRISLRV